MCGRGMSLMSAVRTKRNNRGVKKMNTFKRNALPQWKSSLCGLRIASALILLAVSGCCAPDRNGAFYFTTRSLDGSATVGASIFYGGTIFCPPSIPIAWPLGLATTATEKFVLYPIWDTLCIPYDLYLRSQSPTNEFPIKVYRCWDIGGIH